MYRHAIFKYNDEESDYFQIVDRSWERLFPVV